MKSVVCSSILIMLLSACQKSQTAETITVVADIEGNQYQTVQIGSQLWMAENLRSGRYCNGDVIPNVQDSIQWGNLNYGAWVHMNNNPSNEVPYGKLYNWYAVNDQRNICPCGWHVATDAEWNTLVRYLDNNYNPTIIGGQSIIAGGKIKAVGTQYWKEPNAGATNESGFSAQPGGSRGDFITFYGINQASYWWSASVESQGDMPYFRRVYFEDTWLDRSFGLKNFGMSVRCVKN